MAKQIKLTEEQLKGLINEAITNALLNEDIDEVNWFRRAGNAIRNGFDNVKNQVGGAVAGAKAGIQHGGTNAASVGRNDYLARKNSELAQSRQQEADAAIAEFRKEYGQKVGELNRWKANEIRQIKQMYGADAFSKKAGAAVASAQAGREAHNNFWQGGNNAAQNSYRRVDEAIEKIVEESIKKVLG